MWQILFRLAILYMSNKCYQMTFCIHICTHQYIHHIVYYIYIYNQWQLFRDNQFAICIKSPHKSIYIYIVSNFCCVQYLNLCQVNACWSVTYFLSLSFGSSLQWRHNGFDGVSNRQPHDYSLFVYQSSASLASVRGIYRWPVNSPHKRPVTREMFPFDDVIIWYEICGSASNFSTSCNRMKSHDYILSQQGLTWYYDSHTSGVMYILDINWTTCHWRFTEICRNLVGFLNDVIWIKEIFWIVNSNEPF